MLSRSGSVKAVIMAGGHGERFWPKSRFHKPKQLLAIAGSDTMLQATVRRIESVIPLKNIYVVAGRELEKEVKKQLPGLPRRNLICEPYGRNTAAAIGLAAVLIGKEDEYATMVVLPSDHVILNKRKFLSCVRVAVKNAQEKDALVVFGIEPDRPETGYGYVKAGRKLAQENDVEVLEVEAFVEKPDERRARQFLRSHRYFWNSGMFVWTHRAITHAIEEHMPRLSRGMDRIRNAASSSRDRIIDEVYSGLKNISIDYGVMEKASNRVVVRGRFQWDDVGSWLAMEKMWPRDGNGNVSRGEFVGIDTYNSIVMGEKHLVAAIGISDMVVISTPDATLICPREKAQEVKKMVKRLLDSGLKKYVE